MQRTADFHKQIADPSLSEAAGVMDHAAALDAAVDVRDAPIRGFLRPRQGPATWLSSRHHHLDLVQRERQEAQILEQPAARR
jgi:hypothetical protein